MPQLLSEQQINLLKKRAAAASIGLSAALTVIKTVGVIYTGSLSVLSSMIDSLADLFASGVTFWAIRVSSQPADPRHRYGHGKAEALSALVQAAFITGSGLFILADGIHRLLLPQPLPQTSLGIGIMILCLLLTLSLITFQSYVAHRTHSQAIRADAAHYSVDVLTNVAIILTLIAVRWLGIDWFDTLTAFVIAGYLLICAHGLGKDALALLMDKELDDSIRETVIKTSLSCSHIQGLHDLRTHDLGGAYLFEFHLELDGKLSLEQTHKHTLKVEEKLRQIYPNAQIIIHQDPSGMRENRLDYQIEGHCDL